MIITANLASAPYRFVLHLGNVGLNVAKQEDDDADLAFEQAQSADEAGDKAGAETLYRRAMQLDPSDPAAGLSLGNLLRDQKRMVEAEAAYHWAIKADLHFAPAWHNLWDLLDEGGRLSEAVDCAGGDLGCRIAALSRTR